MLTFEIENKIDEIIELYGKNKSSIITVLQDIQAEYNYLPAEILEYVSLQMDISPSKIFGIATFYENSSLEPKGKYVIKICDGTACHVRKSIPIIETLRKELSLSNDKKTTDDMLLTLETVSCLGACGLAPVLTINEKVYGSMTPDSTVAALNQLRQVERNED